MDKVNLDKAIAIMEHIKEAVRRNINVEVNMGLNSHGILVVSTNNNLFPITVTNKSVDTLINEIIEQIETEEN